MIRIFALFILTCSTYISAAQAQHRKFVSVETSQGTFRILIPPSSSRNAAQFVRLVDSKFYNGVLFHSVIDGYVLQTGDPTGTGRGGSTLPNLPFEPTASKFPSGTVAMTRLKQDELSANSQFFIVLKDAPHLEKKYSVIGTVFGGMPVVKKLKYNDKIIKMEVEK